MKLLLSLAIAIAVLPFYAVGSQKSESMDTQRRMRQHGHKPGHSKHHGKHHHKGERHRQMFESLNKDQQTVYTEMQNFQNNIRKNMHALGQERRNIKNLTNSDARKKSQETINRICTDIKRTVEEYESKVVDAINTLQ